MGTLQTKFCERKVQIEWKQGHVHLLRFQLTLLVLISQKSYCLLEREGTYKPGILPNYGALTEIRESLQHLFIAILGVAISALVEAAVPKAAECVNDFKKSGQRDTVLLLLRTKAERCRIIV